MYLRCVHHGQGQSAFGWFRGVHDREIVVDNPANGGCWRGWTDPGEEPLQIPVLSVARYDRLDQTYPTES